MVRSPGQHAGYYNRAVGLQLRWELEVEERRAVVEVGES